MTVVRPNIAAILQLLVFPYLLFMTVISAIAAIATTFAVLTSAAFLWERFTAEVAIFGAWSLIALFISIHNVAAFLELANQPDKRRHLTAIGLSAFALLSFCVLAAWAEAAEARTQTAKSLEAA